MRKRHWMSLIAAVAFFCDSPLLYAEDLGGEALSASELEDLIAYLKSL